MLRETFGRLVDAVTTAAHVTLARDEIDKRHELYLSDQQDQDGIAEPAAKIAARHGLLNGASTDVADGINLAIAVFGYVSKQLRKRRDIAKERQLGPGAGIPQPEAVDA